MAKKTNKNMTFEKDPDKTYIFIKDGKTTVGMLAWHFEKKIWVLDRHKKKKRK